MIADLYIYGVFLIVAIVAGAVAGCLVSWKLRQSEPATESVAPEPDADPFIDAEIDLASVRWAEANNRPPEAAGLMAERLKTLHNIGRKKGWV